MEFFAIGALIAAVVAGIAVIVTIVKAYSRKEENSEAEDRVEEKLKSKGFKIEKEVGLAAKLYVDNTQKLWAVKEWNDSDDVEIYKYSQLLDFELIEDNESVMQGGFGKALVGGVLGGTTGAIIGSAGSRKINSNCSLLQIRIRTDNFDKPQYAINLIAGGASFPKNSSIYKERFEEAQKIVALLQYISSNGEISQNNASAQPAGSSLADKLRELNALKNEGILTEEEFEKEKAKLLNKN